MPTTLDVFPTRLFGLDVGKEAALRVLAEVEAKKDQIALVSRSCVQQHSDNYITDYSNPVKLDFFEREIIPAVERDFSAAGMNFQLRNYWTAGYKYTGFHQAHDHADGYLFAGSANYSGVLYLSDLGGTELFSGNPSSLEKRFRADSKLGAIVMFPSNVVHTYSPTFINADFRFVVPFNAMVTSDAY